MRYKRRIAQVDVGRVHGNFGAQDVRALRKVALLHALKELASSRRRCGRGTDCPDRAP